VTNTTTDALLDAAEVEFAVAGIESGSLRKIMREAGVDPGAIHYHFGNRDALAAAVLDRLLVPLNKRRLELLNDAVTTIRTPSVTHLVDALIRPDVETAVHLHAQSAGRARLMGAIYTQPSVFVADTVAAHFAPVANAFRPHLEAALPHLTFDVIAWRTRWCVFGTLGALLNDTTALTTQPAHELTNQLTHTLAAALAAGLWI
jgi:AcrR family transcriptional regulator